LSILVEETQADLKQWNVEILGSDIDQQALAQAQNAVYRAWSFRGPAFIARYFRANGVDLQLLDPVKQRVIFAQALVYQKDSTAPHAVWATPKPLAAAVKPMAQAESVISLAKAWALANRGEVAAATEMCDTLIRHQPLDADVRYLYAVLLLASGLTDKARETLRHVLYLDPQFAVAYAMLMDVEMCAHDADAALKACKQGLKALSTQPDNQPVPYFKATTFQEFRLHLQ
jgi:tetratricopeptide (TPR) repeat protein